MFMLTGLFWSNLSVLSSLSRGAAYAIHLGRLRHRSESILIHVGDVESHSGCKCGGSFEPNTHPWLPLSVHEIILARLSFSAQIQKCNSRETTKHPHGTRRLQAHSEGISKCILYLYMVKNNLTPM
ncbi:uncharacterized protein LOC143145075 isoform X1 [Ptiloglossa arizonensis]|uniref:uncharacterized protein LOC143145075 isoform X1 n=1 Tax=Ptiloglossa arizonensis TaxID=3350558 RepID=UPI003FA11CD0